jgi:hypothetical protein
MLVVEPITARVRAPREQRGKDRPSGPYSIDGGSETGLSKAAALDNSVRCGMVRRNAGDASWMLKHDT